MSLKNRIILCLVCLTVACVVQAGETTNTTSAVTPSPASAGLLNDYLREDNAAFERWDFGGQLRARLEHKEYFAAPGAGAAAVDFAARGDANNTYFLLREKIHVGYSPFDWLAVYGEGRDSSSQNDDRNPNVDSDTFDLYQGYIKLGDPKAFPLTLKVGRQELQYGNERLIGNADWNNVPRSFDAARLRYENDLFWADAFVSRPVIPRDNAFNPSNGDDNFSGLYASTAKLLPKTETQFYFLARNTGVNAAKAVSDPLVGLPSPRDIYTAGGRLKSLPGELDGWDYEVEGAYQFGRFKSSATSKSLQQDAFATEVAGGYTWANAFGQPRIGLEYDYGSGDNNPNDGKHGTFDNLFPTNHKFYGYMDFVSWQNIHDLRFTASLKPIKRLTLAADVHGFWLADTHDFFYSVSGAPRRTGGYGINPNAGSYAGTEIDLVATYALKGYASLQGGYGHFFVGDYVRESLSSAGGSKDANWLYAQVVFNF